MACQLHQVTGFDLATTLESGQAFRWRNTGPARFKGLLGNSVVTLYQQGFLLNAEADLPADLLQPRLLSYLRNDQAWPSLWHSVDVDPFVHSAIAATAGLRIIRQDPWECLASFICSSFNNIVRIQGMIERLCQTFGCAIPHRGEIHFTFPGPQILACADPMALRKIGFGYRAPYLVEAARQVDSGEVEMSAIAKLSYLDAREALLQVEGVGEKVVDCVLLFGLGYFEAFPVDVWINRVMRKLYFRNRKIPDRKIRAFARRHFGARCGLAQQALFHAARTGFLKQELI